MAGTATLVGLGANAIEQLLRPNIGETFVNGAVDIFSGSMGNRFPILGPAINELGENLKKSDTAKTIQNNINNGSR